MDKKDYQEVYDALRADFPDNAYTKDMSRGFALTSLRHAEVLKRLTEVFGLPGVYWRFTHGPFETVGKEVVVEVAIQYRVDEGAYPIRWVDSEGWVYSTQGSPVWSEPVFGVGGNQIGTGGVPVSDAKKSAVSNGIGKAASILGVGQSMYLGLVKLDGKSVHIAGESPSDRKYKETQTALYASLGELLRADPEAYDKLRAENKQAQVYHSSKLLPGVVATVKKADAQQFVADNLGAIVHDQEKKKLSDLTARELIFVYDVVSAIESGDTDWKGALKITSEWDRSSSWHDIFVPGVEDE